MTGVDAFQEHADRYEQWFVDHPLAYVSELHAVRSLLPLEGTGVEIGVGTGRFAAPLGIKNGIEPSAAMAELARKRGVAVVTGVAEKLPFPDRAFDFALMVTTVCFLDDRDLAFQEARRILKQGGSFIIGFVDRESPLGREYLRRKDRSLFYRQATFYSVPDILSALDTAGFAGFSICQTIFSPLAEMEQVDPVKQGYGEGSFVVVRGTRT